MIRPVAADDAEAIAGIYNHYIEQTVITFEERAVSADEVRLRIETVTGGYPWYVAEDAGRVVGYAYAGPFHSRAAYRPTAETTVYLSSSHTRRGVGSALYTVLLDDLRERGLHCALAGIALPNRASVALHERFGFRQVGEFKEVGFKLGKRVDVGFWQLLL